MAHHLEKRWKKLFNSALYRAQTLQSTKLKFADMTLSEIKSFGATVSINISFVFSSNDTFCCGYLRER